MFHCYSWEVRKHWLFRGLFTDLYGIIRGHSWNPLVPKHCNRDITPWKFNNPPEKRPSKKERIVFQASFFIGWDIFFPGEFSDGIQKSRIIWTKPLFWVQIVNFQGWDWDYFMPLVTGNVSFWGSVRLVVDDGIGKHWSRRLFLEVWRERNLGKLLEELKVGWWCWMMMLNDDDDDDDDVGWSTLRLDVGVQWVLSYD